jgi:hypothetical protein
MTTLELLVVIEEKSPSLVNPLAQVQSDCT